MGRMRTAGGFLWMQQYDAASPDMGANPLDDAFLSQDKRTCFLRSRWCLLLPLLVYRGIAISAHGPHVRGSDRGGISVSGARQRLLAATAEVGTCSYDRVSDC